ncbi:GNAT family N-acetyltransferase [Fulvivirgaceae bacterium BMA12]|uniref:GNAT family N-acetyltransferase n=1 Tax=Agaribacillus aureus TaxID=3051825 RepID=A0ABT8LAJ2_9BACT|nr:GNAT family N-acetyltransferase [Fulvivirgaceae bacterium BMA12]
MNNTIINNLFELWRFIGTGTKSFHRRKGYEYVMSPELSWPNTIFGINGELADFQSMYQSIEKGKLPLSIAFSGDALLEKQLSDHHFVPKSTVKGMYLNLSSISKPANHFSAIEKVDSEEKAVEFAAIASGSFGYKVAPAVILPLIDMAPKIKLFIASHEGVFSNCGLLFLDSNGISGLHMIGTLPDCRGLGLGKIMTHKLLYEAFENTSRQVVLVASEAGERIYSKMGFEVSGALNIYTTKTSGNET